MLRLNRPEGRIAVTGARGRLGSELVRRGCLPVEADVTDPLALRAALEKVSPDVVVHCAAFTDVDHCEVAPLHAARVNMFGTFNLAQMFAGKIVYLSSDFIFDGRDGPYDEDTRPSPVNIYGWSKLGGELALTGSLSWPTGRGGQEYLIVRTTLLFDRYSKNLVTWIAGQLRQGHSVSLSPDLLGSPTYVPHLADGLLAAVERGLTGILNLAGAQLVSRHRLGRWVAAVLGADGALVREGEHPGRARRPMRAGLRVDKARVLGLPIGDLADGLEAALIER